MGKSVIAPQSLTCAYPSGLSDLGGLDGLRPRERSSARQSATQSTCCSIDTAMFDSADGLPGPVIRKEVRKVHRHQSEVRRRTVRPFSLSDTPRRPAMSIAIIVTVTASKPVANTIESNVNDPVSGFDARVGDADDRVLAQIDQSHRVRL